MIPFAMVFENRKPQARELIVIAVLAAIAVAGRAAFFMLPQFKPVVAIVIIAGVSLGAEAGFWWALLRDSSLISFWSGTLDALANVLFWHYWFSGGHFLQEGSA